MKKLLVCLLSLAILISMAGCSANAPQTQPTETKPLAEYEFLTPPEGWVNLGLADGRVPLTAGGYTWTQTTGHGTGETMHADQYMQPLPVESMQSISFQAVPIDGVTMSLDGFSAEKGSVVTLDWQTTPDAISGIRCCRYRS